jgi:hypothetical protein
VARPAASILQKRRLSTSSLVSILYILSLLVPEQRADPPLVPRA